jgi:ferredoxin-NADP reductase
MRLSSKTAPNALSLTVSITKAKKSFNRLPECLSEGETIEAFYPGAEFTPNQQNQDACERHEEKKC